MILPDEIEELHAYGITRIYSPDDGRAMGLQGMINELVEKSDFPCGKNVHVDIKNIEKRDYRAIAKLISAVENYSEEVGDTIAQINKIAKGKNIPVLGITGTGGSGKSSLEDEFIRRFLIDFPDKKIAVVCVDPSKRKSSGALLGDRIRMNAISNPRVYVRSMATRQLNLALSKYVKDALNILKVADFDLIILETSGIGQSDTEIVDHSNLTLYVMTPEYGAATQLEKIDMLDFADIISINKFDKRGGMDALRDVKKQYQRNHQLFETEPEIMPVYGTIASQFNNPGVNELYRKIIDKIDEKMKLNWVSGMKVNAETPDKIFIIPPHRTRYLSEISDTVRNYNKWAEEQAEIAHKLHSLKCTIDELNKERKQKTKNSLKPLKSCIKRLMKPGWSQPQDT